MILVRDFTIELWSGTIGALLGAIVGGVAAYLGAATVQRRAEAANHRAAARALLVEMRVNGGQLSFGLNNPHLSDTVWREQLPAIANQLTLKEVEPLIVAYYDLPHLRVDSEETSIRTRRARLDAAGPFLSAIRGLSNKILSRKERDQLEVEIGGFELQLQKNKGYLNDEEQLMKGKPGNLSSQGGSS